MGTCDPYAVNQTHEKSMQKIFACTIPGYQVSTYNKYGQPEKGFNIGWNPVNCGNTHHKSEERKLKD